MLFELKWAHGRASISTDFIIRFCCLSPSNAATGDYCETCAIPEDCKHHGPLRSLRKLARDAQPSSVLSEAHTHRKPQLIDCNAITSLPREVTPCKADANLDVRSDLELCVVSTSHDRLFWHLLAISFVVSTTLDTEPFLC